MLSLPVVIAERGGPSYEVAARVSIRFETGVSALEVACGMEIVHGDPTGRLVDGQFVKKGQIPQIVLDAVVAGMRDEIERRAARGDDVPDLRATVEGAVVHPVDCRLRAFREAGARCVVRVLDGADG